MSDRSDCQYCSGPRDCQSVGPSRGHVPFLCTREALHSGDHVGCHQGRHECEHWSNETEQARQIDDGGPMFPWSAELFGGCSVRTWLAGQALIGLSRTFLEEQIAIPGRGRQPAEHLRQQAIATEEETEQIVGDTCCRLADAVLAALARTEAIR